ncbi:hypothetical protein [Actinoplanes sp. N902-109]|uniref:hypothetical protein n=1 Tax=Actinoplanes sp. (strain N902-109) TaxID=649831 RepID=UPI0003295911|nr:hypothetical protein [Actinoplanes sp. N902-109]AGL14100.1 hypothetical protein L083_0590 [Actinoplanes sp. N902-109]
MSTDFSYANEEAVDAIGVLDKYDTDHGHPAGWTRAVIKKIQQDIQNSPAGKDRTGSYDRDDYSSDENAAYDWYSNDVIEHDHWKALVENYQKDQGSTVKPDAYNPDKQYIDKNDGGFKPPEGTGEYTGGNNPNHELTVSTEALNYFANQLDKVVGDGTGVLYDARNQLNKVEMKPGGFAKAEVLRQKIEGVSANDAGLRGDTMGLMLTLHEALYAVKTNLRQMVRDYDTAEEFNGMTAQQLGDAMDKAWGKIGNVGDYGQSSGTTTGGK